MRKQRIKKYFIEHLRVRGGKWWVWQERRMAYYFMCECDNHEDAKKILRALSEAHKGETDK
jgi:hypothetical protein